MSIEHNSFSQEDHAESVVIPSEVLDLVRFLASTWAEVDRFVYDHCDGDALMKYPVVQGTRNQINLMRIGEQKYNSANLHKAIEWMLTQSVNNRPCDANKT